METENILAEMREAIDSELKKIINETIQNYPAEYVSMLNYQLGWEGDGSNQSAQGKRIRPMLVLLACQGVGGDWHKALPAAAAVELVHNFSLIHDDIQDCSELRRGRPTVWVKWGNAQAINAGDAMLTLSHLAILRLSDFLNDSDVLKAVEMTQTACLKLTRGQHLDIAFEDKDDLPMDLYWKMVEGKTGALLAACLSLGALCGNASNPIIKSLYDIGIKIGNAFQVQDDWLGIWGDNEVTGKSCTSDLSAKKKTYPILLGIHHGKDFCKAWKSMDEIDGKAAAELANLLEAEGHQTATKEMFEQLYHDGFGELTALPCNAEKLQPLIDVLQGLFGRIK